MDRDLGVVDHEDPISRPQCTLVRVPPVVASTPRQDGEEGMNQVEDCPRDYNVIIDTDNARYQHHPIANACKIKIILIFMLGKSIMFIRWIAT